MIYGHTKKKQKREQNICRILVYFSKWVPGKSRTALEILKDKFNAAGRILRTFIFCPPLVVPNWKDEWIKYTKIDKKKVIPLYGSQVKRLQTFKEQAYKDGVKQDVVVITNYESLLMKDLMAAFKEWEAEAIVWDESHKLKSGQAKRSQLADELSNPFDKVFKRRKMKPHTYILSGSPILNSPMDIFMQFKIMDGGATFGSNFFAFRARYFRDRNAGMPKERYFPNWEPMTLEKDGIDALGEINKKIFAKSMRVEKKDCLDLPPEVSIPIKVGMSKEQARLYAEMKKDFVTYYNSRVCQASLAITKALRLMQITSGFVATEMPGDQENATVISELKDTPKREALKQLLLEITEQGQKALVWAVYKHSYQTIREVCDELKLKYVEVHGEISPAKKRSNVDLFKSDPTVSVFIGHPGSGGIGINLTCAAYSIFYSRTFSLEHYLQARARNHRGGAKEEGHDKITHYDLICEGTIEELAVEKLASKLDMSEKLLSDISKELLKQAN